MTWTRVRVSDGKSTVMRVDVDGDDPAPILPWGLGVEVYDLSRATSGPTKGLVLFEAYGRGDPDATFVDLGTVPWLCNGAKECGRKIDWLTNNKASGRRNANPHWSPDGTELRVHRPGEHQHRGRPDLDGEVRDRRAAGDLDVGAVRLPPGLGPLSLSHIRDSRVCGSR